MRKNLSSFILKLYGMTIIYTLLRVNYMSATLVSQLPSTTICAQCYKDPPAIVILRKQPVFIFLYYTVSQGSICHSNTVYMDRKVTPGSWCLTRVHFYIQIGSYFEQHQ